MLSGLLAAGWLQLYVQPTADWGARLVMSMFGLLGIASGVYWTGIGRRSRGYVQKYREIAAFLESDQGKAVNDPKTDPCFAADPGTSAA